MRNIRFYLSFIFLLSFGIQGYSTPQIKISPDTILIGDHVKVKLEFSINKDSEFNIEKSQNFAEGFEYVKTEKEEISEKGDVKNIKLTLIYTSFDSGKIVIPPFPIITSTNDLFDTIFIGDSTILRVGTPVLPDKFEGYDIKGVKSYANLTWLTVLIITIALALIAILIGYIVKRRKANKKEIPFYQAIEKPYKKAMQELQTIKQKNLCEKGEIKEYYTQVTDVIRKYIEKSTGSATMEKTSKEILDTLPTEFDKPELKKYLNKLFNVADLVKFAKHTPLEADNELSWQNAYKFIEESKPKVEEINAQAQEANSEEKVKQ